MIRPDDGLYAALVRRGMSRRAFLKFSAAMAAALALPPAYAPRIAAAVESAPRLPVIWLRGQACGGDTEAFLQAADPTVPELVLDLLSIEYHDALMTASGEAAVAARTAAMARYPDGYLAVVEGAIPSADAAMACTVGGIAFGDVVREVCGGAAATIAVGSCAFDGGAPGADRGPTHAVGVEEAAGDAVRDGRLVNLPGCPVNVVNLTATIVHYLTFKELPPVDAKRRPLFAYGNLLHNQCERRGHYEFGEFALAWGDEGAQKGWCLYKLGCKGPETFANCPTALYAEGTSWAIKAGHGCIGCTMPGFWDSMGPAYQRLPAPIPFAANVPAAHVGALLVGGIAAVTVAHGAATYAREVGRRVRARRRSETVDFTLPRPAERPAAATPPLTQPPAAATPPSTEPPAAATPPISVEPPASSASPGPPAPGGA